MKLTIPTPCHENWEAMAPGEKGKFCAACTKTVLDFTGASDEEIAGIVSSNPENSCGYFRRSQLNRDLRYAFINSLFARFAVGFMMTAAGMVSVHAQEQHHPGENLPAEKKPKEKPLPGILKNDTSSSRHFILGGIHRESIDAYRSPLYVINGKPGTEADFRALDPESISKINILKGASATGRYGKKAGYGAVEITTRRKAGK